MRDLFLISKLVTCDFFFKNQDLKREKEPRATALRNERVESPTDGLAPVSAQYFEKFFWLNDGSSFKRSPYGHKENLRKIMHEISKKKLPTRTILCTSTLHANKFFQVASCALQGIVVRAFLFEGVFDRGRISSRT